MIYWVLAGFVLSQCQLIIFPDQTQRFVDWLLDRVMPKRYRMRQ